ncbi:sugar-transfer associated ATP-grasp domain-containing protein [Flavobacterium sp.]|uniref:sugar-transfer associated ATP-grasp domain-containing protein n=1 Tax=Flavobacterium sp. TaxID=239 RepID=UPI003918B7F1
MKRILYFFYYLKRLDQKKFWLFLNFVSLQKKVSKFKILCDVVYASLKYNISILEYFQFRFFEKKSAERKKWAGTGFMYEYQKIMNPIGERNILDDKTLFHKMYAPFFKHKVYNLETLINDRSSVEEMLKGRKIVLKVSDGKCGVGIEFKDATSFTPDSLIAYMTLHKFDLVETYIEQHEDLMKLSPSAVNTVRIFTQLNEFNSVDIIGCRLRISINCTVDNMAAGNIAAPIHPDTGIVVGPGVYSDITKTPESIHPVTQVPIEGFVVPFWEECVQLAKDAALMHPQNRSIGWDIVVTPDGPGLIEGNHDWCKLVWQLPVSQGLKDLLLKYV